MTVIVQGGRVVNAAASPIAHLRETVADVTRQMEDRNWTNLSSDLTQTAGLDDDFSQRMELLRRIRLYRRRSPLAKQAAKLLQHYVLGQGVSLRPNNKTQVARIVDELWDDPTNRATFTSHQAMSEFLDAVFTDGDVFMLLQPDTELGQLKLGTVDVTRVEDIVCDPDNWRVPLWYKVRKSKQKYDFGTGTVDPSTSGDTEIVWYRDWRNDEPTGRGKNAPSKVEDGLIMHVAINKRGKFGESEMAVAADWLKAHKEFMEDRATIHKAASQVGWKQTMKGPAGTVAQQVQRLQSSLAASLGGGWEANPPHAPASTAVQNEGVNLEWGGANPGSANADEKIFRMMAGVGMGVMNHYFGDEGGARLATATAMELPMLKNYEDYQKLLADVIADVIDFALTVANVAGRIGARDDQSKYTDKTNTDLNTALQGDDEDPSQEPAAPVAEHGFREIEVGGRKYHTAFASEDEPWRKLRLRGQTKARAVNTRESDRQTIRVLKRIETRESQRDKKLFDVDLEEAPAPAATPQQAVATPTAQATAQPGPRTGPLEGSVTTVPSYLQVVPTAIAPDVQSGEYDTEGEIDWYVDIDFPPIVQKDINTYMFALSSMYNMMPLTNLESQKLIVSMALTAFGVNDVEEVMEKLFAPLEFLPSHVQVEREMAMQSGSEFGGGMLPGDIAGMEPGSQLPGVSPEAAVAEPVVEANLSPGARKVLAALQDTTRALQHAQVSGNGVHARG